MRNLFPTILPGRVTSTSLSTSVGSLKPEVERPRKRLMILTGGDVDLAQMELAGIECYGLKFVLSELKISYG